jgi:hypothetical protein
VGQSFGFASELLLGPELALLPMDHREFLAKRAGQKPRPLKDNSKSKRYWAVPPVLIATAKRIPIGAEI